MPAPKEDQGWLHHGGVLSGVKGAPPRGSGVGSAGWGWGSARLPRPSEQKLERPQSFPRVWGMTRNLGGEKWGPKRQAGQFAE